VKENAPNKSTKLGAGLNNLCMLNDFKEGDKIVFEAEVNIPNNEIRVIQVESFFLHNCVYCYLLFSKFVSWFVDI